MGLPASPAMILILVEADAVCVAVTPLACLSLCARRLVPCFARCVSAGDLQLLLWVSLPDAMAVKSSALNAMRSCTDRSCTGLGSCL